jgi:K+-transporting ATPase KdpF subunit
MEEFMGIELIAGLIISIGLIVYLIYSIIFPEKF